MPALESSLDGAFRDGERAKLIPIGRLESLKEELGRFRTEGALNGFQRWILDGLYKLDPPGGFPSASMIIIAVPHPFFSTVEFEYLGRAYRCLGLVMSNFESAERSLRAALPEGRRILAAKDLPLKRLAVQGGLAEYGRNNICYIDGMGSSFSLMAFFSDLPCREGDWTDLRVAPACDGCGACLEACPTGAIRPDRFLIDNERCLSYFNESGGPFPAWLDKGVHHCVYDCLRCQDSCPMNADRRGTAVGPIRFDAAETELLLSGRWLESCPPALAGKARYLGLRQWPDGVAKNLRAIIDANA
jgi:epoxyqueuosine reductase